MTTYPPAHHDRWPADYLDLKQRLAVVEQQLAQGIGAFGALPCFSTSHPVNPKVGAQIFEEDTGLTAYWSGTAWVYPPQQIAAVVLGAAAATVRIPAAGTIPAVFDNLRLVVSAKGTDTAIAGYTSASLQINGVTTANYAWNSIYTTQGAGSASIAGGTAAVSAQFLEVWNAHFGSAGHGIATVDFPNYAATGVLKAWKGQSQAADGGSVSILQEYGGSLGGSNTGAIGFITALISAGNFDVGSSFFLYGE